MMEHLVEGFRPLPGRCIVRLDPLPDKIGSLFIPDIARDMRPTEPLHSGTVLAMTPRLKKNSAEPHEEQFQTGDRAILALRMEDLNESIILTHNTRIYAIIEP